MAYEVLGVDIEAMHTAIAAQIAAAFPAFRTVEFYRDDESLAGMLTPALLLEMSEAEPSPEFDPGTEQWSTLLRFEAHLILADVSGITQIELRKAATALASWLNLRRWSSITSGPCMVIACEPDELAPQVDGFGQWRIEWTNHALIGVSVWDNSGGVPESCYSFVPRIGLAHEPEYVPFGEGQP